MTPLQKLPKTVGDLSKIIVANGFKKSPKVQKIAKSGHTECNPHRALRSVKRRSSLEEGNEGPLVNQIWLLPLMCCLFCFAFSQAQQLSIGQYEPSSV